MMSVRDWIRTTMTPPPATDGDGQPVDPVKAARNQAGVLQREARSNDELAAVLAGKIAARDADQKVRAFRSHEQVLAYEDATDAMRRELRARQTVQATLDRNAARVDQVAKVLRDKQLEARKARLVLAMQDRFTARLVEVLEEAKVFASDAKVAEIGGPARDYVFALERLGTYLAGDLVVPVREASALLTHDPEVRAIVATDPMAGVDAE